MIKLWKYNQYTGLWDYVRTCDKETAEQWLMIFQNDDLKSAYTLSKNRPTNLVKG